MENKKIDFATRQLMRSSSRGYLATNMSENLKKKTSLEIEHIIPYVTFVMTAFDYDGGPLVLLSDLSEHTKNIGDNNIVSILFYEEQKNTSDFPVFKNKDFIKINDNYEDPMSRPRLTVLGKLKKSFQIEHKKRFLKRHPVSNLYANFKDMNIYKLDVMNAHLTGGFAKVQWFKKDEMLSKDYSGFKEVEDEVINHMNKEHKESLKLYAKVLLGKEPKNVQIVGIDPEGFDMRLSEKLIRFNFPVPLKKASELRKVFIKLHHEAKNKFLSKN